MTIEAVDTGDPRNRPIILRTGSPEESPRRRGPRPRTMLGMIAVALLTAAGVAAGSWSVMSVVGSTAPSGNPAPPLWFSPPALETAEDIPAQPSTEDKPTASRPVDDHPRPQGTAPTTSTESSRGRGGDDHRGPGHSGRG